jgi:hypothetical protein
MNDQPNMEIHMVIGRQAWREQIDRVDVCCSNRFCFFRLTAR